jgi:CHAT domain-containing protein
MSKQKQRILDFGLGDRRVQVLGRQNHNINNLKSKIQNLKWLLSCLILFSLSLGLSIGLPAMSVAQSNPATPAIQNATGRKLLQQGVVLYESERFSDAIAQLKKAAATLQTEKDQQGQALALSNLSLAYQQLSMWQAAKDAIGKSLSLLKPLDRRSQTYAAILAKALNTQGNLLWSQGQAEPALKIWQEAAQHYQKASDVDGIVIAQINQVKALQDLGLNSQGLNLLETTSRILEKQPDQNLKAIGLRYLGEAYRRIGDLDESQDALEASIRATKQPSTKAATLLELGNTQKSMSDQAIAIGKATEAQSYAQASIRSYQSAAQASDSPTLQIQSQLNQLRVSLETGQWSAAATLQGEIHSRVTQLPLSRTAVNAQLNFADSLSCLKQLSTKKELACISPDRQEYLQAPTDLQNLPSWEAIAQLVAKAVEQSRQLADPVTESYALGQLGHLYEITQQWSEAQTLTQQALLRLEGIQAPEIAYQWSWQLGRLLKQRDNVRGAMAAYRNAIQVLEAVQGDLLVINRETRFSFRDRVEPVYREFVDLLLTSGTNNPLSQNDLRQAIRTVDSLQLVELKNFLGCELPRVRIDEASVDPTSAKIYPIILENRLVILFEIANQPLSYFEVPVSRKDIEATAKSLNRSLTEPGQTPEALKEARKLYQWLIAPLEPTLAKSKQIKTLVFVPDRALRTVPMAVLYDGKQYLLEKNYAIAVAPRLELFQPKPLSQRLSILAGGVGIPQVIRGRPFEEIKQLEEEIQQIPKGMLATSPLLNQNFTISQIEERLKTGRYSAIHWKTHGIFSSDPTETFIVAYKSSISTNDLIEILQGARERRVEPLELLILSACETARGDNRAVLGMAGTAMNAGASSILSTLWRADDAATTTLMSKFYQALSEPGTTRAAALRQAQLSLLTEYGYSAPYYWSTYVLVGNWL